MELQPTHTCFDDALDWIDLMVKANRMRQEEWVLIHALCEFEGERYAHAWCERDGAWVVTRYVINGVATYVEVRREEHYQIFNPVMVRNYTVNAAAQQNLIHGHYGPWDSEIRKHCHGGRRIIGATKVQVH
jgi:hypothetical protein